MSDTITDRPREELAEQIDKTKAALAALYERAFTPPLPREILDTFERARRKREGAPT